MLYVGCYDAEQTFLNDYCGFSPDGEPQYSICIKWLNKASRHSYCFPALLVLKSASLSLEYYEAALNTGT